MAINAYSRGPVAPQFVNSYTSQYVQAPLEYAGAALQARQATYDHFLEGQQTLHQGLMGIQAATPSDSAYLKKAQGEYDKQLAAFADQDLSRPEVQRGLRELGNQISSDRTLQGIQATHSRMGELQANAKKLNSEGKFYAPQSALNTRELEAYEQAGGAAGGASFRGMDYNPAQDHVKEADQIFSVLHANEQEGIRKLAAEGGDIAYKLSSGGIGSDKVYGAYKGAANQWLTSLAGQQITQMYKAQGLSDSQAQQGSLKFLLDRGMATTYSKSSTNLDVALNKGRDEKKAEKEKASTSMWADLGLTQQAGDAPEFENGKLVNTTGAFEIGAKVYQDARAKGQNPIAALAYAGLGGIAHLVNSDGQAQKLEEKYNSQGTQLQKAYDFYKQQNPNSKETVEEYYKRNDVKLDQRMPLITDGKLSRDLGQSMVETGAINNMVLYDSRGQKVNPKDLLKFDEDGKLKTQVGVLTDPSAKFSTAKANRAMVVSIGGERYTAELDGNAHNRPMPQEVKTQRDMDQIDLHNQRLMQMAQEEKLVQGVYYDVDKQGKVTPIPANVHYDVNLPHPMIYPMGN